MRSPVTRLPLLLASLLLASALAIVALPAPSEAAIAGNISGRVTQMEVKFHECEYAYSGDFSVLVDAFNVSTLERVGPAFADAGGHFQILNVPPGDYKVRYRRISSDGMHSYAWFSANTAIDKPTYEQGLAVTVGEFGTTTANACLTDQGGGAFKGTVTTNVPGAGPECTYVHFFEATSGIGTGVVTNTRTNGIFRSMNGFPPGQYRALAIVTTAPGCDGTALDQWWKGHSGELGRNSDGTTVMANGNLFGSGRKITLGSTVRKGIHFQLVPIGTCDGKVPTILGTTADDVITGTYSPDVIKTFAGADQIDGLGGRDSICAGSGNDNVDGGIRNDRIFGDAGNDYIVGGGHNDFLFGGSGNDQLFGGTGSDKIRGGIGSDLINGDAGNDRLYGEKGNDNIYGGTEDDRIYGGPGDDYGSGDEGTDKCDAAVETKNACEI